jgi:hypothetical protein
MEISNLEKIKKENRIIKKELEEAVFSKNEALFVIDKL